MEWFLLSFSHKFLYQGKTKRAYHLSMQNFALTRALQLWEFSKGTKVNYGRSFHSKRNSNIRWWRLQLIALLQIAKSIHVQLQCSWKVCNRRKNLEIRSIWSTKKTTVCSINQISKLSWVKKAHFLSFTICQCSQLWVNITRLKDFDYFQRFGKLQHIESWQHWLFMQAASPMTQQSSPSTVGCSTHKGSPAVDPIGCNGGLHLVSQFTVPFAKHWQVSSQPWSKGPMP